MKARFRQRLLAALFLSATAAAQTQLTWTGASDNTVINSANWSPVANPDGNDLVFDGTSSVATLNLAGALSANSVTLTGSYPDLVFTSTSAGVLALGAGGVSIANTGAGSATFSDKITIELTANQTWAVNGDLSVYSLILDNPAGQSLTKTGSGTLVLGGTNTFSGGVTVQAGTLVVASSSLSANGSVVYSPVGTGTLTLASGTTLASTNTQTTNVTMDNPVVLGSTVTGNNVTFSQIDGGGNSSDGPALTLTGTLTAGSTATRLHVGAKSLILVNGTVTGPSGTTLTIDSTGSGLGGLVLNGTVSSSITQIVDDGGGLLFGNANSLPTGLVVSVINNGYAGIGILSTHSNGPSPSADTLLARIASPSAFAGTFGFDSDSDAPLRFANNYDFSNFTNTAFAIGSATRALLSGTLTAPTNGTSAWYRFGGSGGGLLVVDSNLPDNLAPGTSTPMPTSVTVTTPSGRDPGTVIFRGANAYTGTTTLGTATANLAIDHAIVILDSPSALPTSATLALGSAAYVGVTKASNLGGLPGLVSRLAPNGTTATSILGIDSDAYVTNLIDNGDNGQTGLTRFYGGAIDLRSFSSIYFGTASDLDLTSSVAVYAPADQTLRLTAVRGGHLSIDALLSSANVGSVTIGYPTAGTESLRFGKGTVELRNTNTYTGGTTLLSGTLALTNSGALGTGALTVGNAAESTRPNLVATSSGMLTLANNLVLNSDLQVGWSNSSSTQFTQNSNPIELVGAISGAGGLIANNDLILTGANTSTGGVTADTGRVVLATATAVASLPVANSLTAYDQGYIGLGDTTVAVQSGFVDRFDKGATSGTIGFDTISGAPQTFDSPIDLTGFSGTPRLGSATSAIIGIKATITPSDQTYRFGGGGGYLEVDASLNDAVINNRNVQRGLDITSPDTAPLTVRLTNTGDTFSGDVNVSHSALIVGVGALPTTVALIPGTGSYIGTEEDPTTAAVSWLGRFDPNLSVGTIGFDTSTTTARVISGNLDLTRFTGSTPEFRLGTATSLQLTSTATISLPGNATAYRFAAYNGGSLQLDLPLTDASSATLHTSLVLGDPDAQATQQSTRGASSTITITNGANTFSGGTTLYAGSLYLGASTTKSSGTLTQGPLGTGSLQVEPSNFEHDSPDFSSGMHPFLGVSSGLQELANSIQLDTDLAVGGNLTLSGSVTGSGELYKIDPNTLTISGHNTSWVGGVYVSQGNVAFANDDSAGSGPLSMGTLQAPSVSFLSSAPTIGSLSGDNSADQINLAANSVLHVIQDGQTQFDGQVTGVGAVVSLQGYNPNVTNMLTLTGTSTYSGGTTIGPNIFVLSAGTSALGTGNVTLNGGTLDVANGTSLNFGTSANRSLITTSGTLAGTGTLGIDTTSLTISNHVTLSPGFGGSGTFNVALSGGATLTFDSGGTYHWEMRDASNASGGWASIAVTGGALNITATSTNPFEISLNTMGSNGAGLAANFNIDNSYSWTLLTASSITGFAANKFDLQTAGFLNVGYGMGTFSLNVNNVSAPTSLILSYTPAAIPEPSTWALLLGGLGLVALTLRRRRLAN